MKIGFSDVYSRSSLFKNLIKILVTFCRGEREVELEHKIQSGDRNS